MIDFHQVYKTYRTQGRELVALQATSLSIASGEIFGLIGHSGAGKSTLLRLINRLEEPSGGRIVIAGHDCTALDATGLRHLRQQVGMIFQHFNLLSSKTVAENISLPLKLAGVLPAPAIAQRVRELLERVSLSDQAHKYPAQLSGGQKQRVGIARALANRPKILLCDEATSALDPQTTKQVLQLLAEINRDLKITIVLITHEMEVIRRVCDRVAVLEAGQIVEQGKVTEVFLHPKHPTTKRFVQEAEHITDHAQHDDFFHVTGRIVRLTFQGQVTYTPLLGRLTQKTGVICNILSGRIARIGSTPYGQLTVALTSGDVDAAMVWLKDTEVHVEVLR